jgi:hypothetical protein
MNQIITVKDGITILDQNVILYDYVLQKHKREGDEFGKGILDRE